MLRYTPMLTCGFFLWKTVANPRAKLGFCTNTRWTGLRPLELREATLLVRKNGFKDLVKADIVDVRTMPGRRKETKGSEGRRVGETEGAFVFHHPQTRFLEICRQEMSAKASKTSPIHSNIRLRTFIASDLAHLK